MELLNSKIAGKLCSHRDANAACRGAVNLGEELVIRAYIDDTSPIFLLSIRLLTYLLLDIYIYIYIFIILSSSKSLSLTNSSFLGISTVS